MLTPSIRTALIDSEAFWFCNAEVQFSDVPFDYTFFLSCFKFFPFFHDGSQELA